MKNTGNATVDQMYNFEPRGNIIDNNWFKTIQKNGKADLLAINILADVVYWYRPTIVRDESTGHNIELKKKFRADLLQRTYDSYATQFGVTKRQVQDAVKRLHDIGIVKKVLRNIRSKTGVFLSNVMYLELNYEMLIALSTPSYVFSYEDIHKNVPPPTQKRKTYTKSTPNTSTETIKDLKNKGIFDSKNVEFQKFTDDSQELFDFYKDYYKKYTGREHPFVNQATKAKINKLTESLDVYDNEYNKTLDISIDYLKDMIIKYFNNNYDCDRNINHFLDENILRNLWYQANSEFIDNVG